MKNSSYLVKYIFIGVSVLELMAHAMEMPELNKYSKPLLMPVLLVYFRRELSTAPNLSFLIAAGALIFSWVGDVSLMYQHADPLYFLVGLSAFAVALVLYAFSFSRARYNNESAISIGRQVAYAVPFVLIGFGLMWKLVPAAGDLAYPLIVYALVMLVMVISAILRMEQTNQASFNQVFFGAILFLLSDSLLALNKFLMPMENSGLFIMLTYILAQWNIISGLLKHYNEA